jgi:putative component of membrane protein insertase Oxa1/YidC/SpoIIIJ protein YidD
MTTAVAVGLIDLYQQYISPHKGFRCAHRAKHGRSSCSQFAKRLIQKVGLLRFWPILTRRFEKCGKAARALKARAVQRRSFVNERRLREDERKPTGYGDVSNGCDPSIACDAADCAAHLSVPDGCHAPDLASGCDGAHACDLAHGCDVGGCDFTP